jgi:hypothetical protein
MTIRNGLKILLELMREVIDSDWSLKKSSNGSLKLKISFNKSKDRSLSVKMKSRDFKNFMRVEQTLKFYQ